jgi:hypothetical protein
LSWGVTRSAEAAGTLEATGTADQSDPKGDEARSGDWPFIDRRLDLVRALGTLRPVDCSLCIELLDSTPTEISRSRAVSRATVYRRLDNIREQLVAEGVSWP